MSDFCDVIKRVRAERQMTMEEFANLLGTTKQNISRYENGSVSPKITTAMGYAEKLGMTLAELSGIEEKEHINAVPMLGDIAAGKPIANEELALLSKIKSLPVADRQLVIELIDRLAKS